MRLVNAKRDCCGNCRYYLSLEVVDEVSKGICRRHAPTVLAQPGVTHLGQHAVQSMSIFPPMMENQWCGDHKRK